MSSIDTQITRRPGDGKFVTEMQDAQRGGYSTITYDRIRAGISRGALEIPKTMGRGYRLDTDRGGIGERESNAQKRELLCAVAPEVVRYLMRLGDAFADRFGDGRYFEITSLNRTQEYYQKMSGAKSSTGKSSHKYAMSFDIAHNRLPAHERQWLYQYMATAQRRGEVSVAKEGRHALHVFVIPSALVRRANQATDRFLGSRGLDPADLQRQLKERGLYHGEIDGELGRLSFIAIRNYQRKLFGTRYAQLLDGIVGPGTYRRLFVAKAHERAIPLWKQAQNETMQFLKEQNIAPRSLQRYLKDAGYFSKEINGVVGPASYGAICRFQSAHNLRVDGIVGPKTWSLLKSNA